VVAGEKIDYKSFDRIHLTCIDHPYRMKWGNSQNTLSYYCFFYCCAVYSKWSCAIVWSTSLCASWMWWLKHESCQSDCIRLNM
jgi:hypothetical protein